MRLLEAGPKRVCRITGRLWRPAELSAPVPHEEWRIEMSLNLKIKTEMDKITCPLLL